MTTVRFRFRNWLILLLCTLTCASGISVAQVNYNQRDDKYRLLGLKRAKEAFEVAKRDYERQNGLFGKGLISQIELDRSHNVYSDAEVNYQQSLLAVLFEMQFVTVHGAVKYQSPDGSKWVRLTLANTSGGGEEFQKLLGIEDRLFRSLQPDVISYVYVSLANQEGAVISQPYEAKVERLRFGSPKELRFQLLQDLDAVSVNLIYGNGTTRSMKIFLQKDKSANKVLVQSQQFSQEGELGTSATYDLTLELFSAANSTFSLEVINLPQQINRLFRDVASNARLSQFKFTEASNSRRAALEVTLPDRPTEAVPMDSAIAFYVLVVPTDRSGEILSKVNTRWALADIERLEVGYVRLELVPRGKGRLIVKAPQLYHTVRPGESVEATIDILNEGTRRLDNVQVKVDAPLLWGKDVVPTIIPSIDIGEEKRVTIRATPSDDASVGRYELRLRTSALSDNEPVNAEDKTLTVEIAAETNVWGTALLVVVILGLVGGMVIFGIRLSKR
ncbi:MAG: hypothetical protein A3G43_08535 [Ignavibacteria bacterium RIFCSPLOWO2_12_FULL_56_21]|nr:MAG: hypothetical protein A3C56_04340 [Ignavibacteria bacterium RIFCSPHIGHO2_02_FULL_56_12]OGU71582.1 MAG: hypothetical protein A3G43_08535 [Ignavibacteria bacterium RIFCSPLOWO2_12_FULL_56_21]